jgi:hypothetical protein
VAAAPPPLAAGVVGVAGTGVGLGGTGVGVGGRGVGVGDSPPHATNPSSISDATTSIASPVFTLSTTSSF